MFPFANRNRSPPPIFVLYAAELIRLNIGIGDKCALGGGQVQGCRVPGSNDSKVQEGKAGKIRNTPQRRLAEVVCLTGASMSCTL